MDNLLVEHTSTRWIARSQRMQTVAIVGLGIALSLLFAGLTLAFNFGSIALLGVIVIVAYVMWKPRIGVFFSLGMVLLFEEFSRFDGLMLPGRFFHNSLGSTAGVAGIIFTPFELLLVLTFSSWLTQGLVRHELTFRGGALSRQMSLFGLALLIGFGRGALGGGNLNIGFYEVRALIYLVIAYVLASNMVRTRQHVQAVLGIFLVTNVLFAIEGAYRRLALVDAGLIAGDLVYEHDDAVFLGGFVLLVIGLHVFGAPRWQRWLGLLGLPIVGYTLMASQRRAGILALLISLALFGLVFFVSHRRAFLRFVVPMMIVMAIYFPAFWNNTSVLGQPARAVRSTFQPDQRDAMSNGARELEKINLIATINSDPVWGVGFGREYLFVVPVADISSWPFWRYETHRNVQWVWLKTGALGFALFFILMGSGIVRAAQLVRIRVDPTTRVFALSALGTIISVLVFSYVDIGLTVARITLVLGTTLGILAVLDRIPDEALPEAAAAQRGRPLFPLRQRSLRAPATPA